MSHGESLQGYPDDNVVYKDEHGDSRIFQPALWDVVSKCSTELLRYEILYRQRASNSAWFMLEQILEFRFSRHQELRRDAETGGSQQLAAIWWGIGITALLGAASLAVSILGIMRE